MPEKQIQTRRQLAYSKREKEQARLIYRSLAGVGGLIAVVLVIGLLQTYVFEPAAAIAVVNGTEITNQAYRNRASYERFLLEMRLAQIQQQRQSLVEQGNEQKGNEQFVQFYDQLANQAIQQLNLVYQRTLDEMMMDELVEVEAANRGITVSEEEINEEINRIIAGQSGGLTEVSASETVAARVEASATAASWTPTPTLTPSPTLTTSKELSPTATPQNTPVPQPTPTLNIIGDSDLATNYQTWLTQLDDSIGINEAEYRDFIRLTLLRQKMRDVIGDDVPNTAEQSRARHILISKNVEPQFDDEGNVIELSEAEQTQAEETAQTEAKALADELAERLVNGADFAELAEEYSDDPGSKTEGGDLGFVIRGTFVESVDDAVFTLPLNAISDPIESQFGWHIIEVLERGDRELSPSDYSQLQDKTYTEWLNDLRADAEIEDYWTPDKIP